jgi:tRNA (guanine37-N1)-methyltransferase
MHIEILTIFPGYFESPLRESLLGKGIASGLLEVVVTDLRQFATDRHHKVDDEPYGGGPGMVMMAPVVAAAVEARRGSPPAWSVLLAPDGERLDQGKLADLSRQSRILLFCGRYEGIDERSRELGLFDQEISLGDFVLPGGEAAALAIVEALSRLVPGVVARAESVERESFVNQRPRLPPLHASPRVSGARRPRSASCPATTRGSSAGESEGPEGDPPPAARPAPRAPEQPGERDE